MKKILTYLVTFVFLSLPYLVKANEIYGIDITTDIDIYGNATITEVWDMYVNEGTEVYKPMGNLDNSMITNFRVVDENKRIYTFTNWNINHSFNEKAYHNGIHETENGNIELCWGMSSYGKHKYTISYNVSNFVRIADYDIVYWKFVNDSMNPYPKKIIITVNYPNNSLIDIYNFGFEGKYEKNANFVRAYSTKFKSNNYAVMLMKFKKGTFISNNIKNESYDNIYKNAIKGVKVLERKRLISMIIQIVKIVLSILAIFLFILLAAIFYDKNKFHFESNLDISKKDNYFRDIPTNDLLYAYFITYAYNISSTIKETDIVGVLLLKWIKNGQIKIQDRSKKTKLDLSSEYMGSDKFEKEMYNMMKKASKNNILEAKEFGKWCSNNPTKYNNWFTNVKKFYEEKLKNEGKIYTAYRRKIFRYQVKFIKKEVDEIAIQITGLRNFLIAFSRMDIKEAIEVQLWDYYLMYAQLFGIADKVAKQFKKLYPDLIKEENYTMMDYYVIHNFSNAVSKSMYSSSSSGSSYSGGGHGSFGGGSGGGCR